MGGAVCACGYVGFLPWFFVGFALTAVESIVLADTVMKNQIISSLNRTNALYNMVLPSLFGEMDLHPTKLEEMARSAVIPTNIHSITPRSRRNEQSIPPPMKNERHMPNEIY